MSRQSHFTAYSLAVPVETGGHCSRRSGAATSTSRCLSPQQGTGTRDELAVGHTDDGLGKLTFALLVKRSVTSAVTLAVKPCVWKGVSVRQAD